jgi:hypothetical protein
MNIATKIFKPLCGQTSPPLRLAAFVGTVFFKDSEDYIA